MLKMIKEDCGRLRDRGEKFLDEFAMLLRNLGHKYDMMSITANVTEEGPYYGTCSEQSGSLISD
jgi:hypothetical protein